MEQETMLKEILHTLKAQAERTDQKLDQFKIEMNERFDSVDKRFDSVDERFDKVENRFDRLEKKIDGNRVELTEVQKTTDFL